jgi:hypothetical protein
MAKTKFSSGVLMLVIAATIIVLVVVILFVGKTAETGQKSERTSPRPVITTPPAETTTSSDELVDLLSTPKIQQEYSVAYNYDYGGRAESSGDVAFTVKGGSITHLESSYSNGPSYSQTFSYSCNQVYDSSTATDTCVCDISAGSPGAALTKEDCATRGLKHELSTVWTLPKMAEEAKYRLTDWKETVAKSGDCYEYGRHPAEGNFQDYEACFKDGVLVKYASSYSDMGNTGSLNWTVV